ncbi:MAG: hypothetical protein ACR2NP_21245 [Pirellulaceae bacterium]
MKMIVPLLVCLCALVTVGNAFGQDSRSSAERPDYFVLAGAVFEDSDKGLVVIRILGDIRPDLASQSVATLALRLEVGDVVTAFNGQRIDSRSDLWDAMRSVRTANTTEMRDPRERSLSSIVLTVRRTRDTQTETLFIAFPSVEDFLHPLVYPLDRLPELHDRPGRLP